MIRFLGQKRNVLGIAEIEERWNREVKQNYKMTLVPVNDDEEVVSYKDYFTSDFMSLIKSSYVKIVD